jgi:hypothetical protein
MAKRGKYKAKEGKHLCLARNKLWRMREIPDTNVLQARVGAEEKNGSGAKRIFNKQDEQVPDLATRSGGRPETKMPMPAREPIWYRHWGLNE